VKVIGDPEGAGPWPAEPFGVIDPTADAPIRVIDTSTMPEVNVPEEERGPTREYLVRFDEPQFDCDGDGPFRAAVIWEKYLQPHP
jgi:hypothetical protein